MNNNPKPIINRGVMRIESSILYPKAIIKSRLTGLKIRLTRNNTKQIKT